MRSRSGQRILWIVAALVAGCPPALPPGEPALKPPPPPASALNCKLSLDDVDRPRVRFETSLGDIWIELFEQETPAAVENFLLYVLEGFYTNTIFHRVEKDLYGLAGRFDTNRNKKDPLAEPIESKADNTLTNAGGTVAMLRDSLDELTSATSQLIFNVADNCNLFDKRSDEPEYAGYAVFGHVVAGMDILEQISRVPTSPQEGFVNLPTDNVVIQSAVVVEPPAIHQGDTQMLSVLKNTDGNELALSATSEDSEGLVWSISTAAGSGTAAVSGTGGSAQVTYTPDTDFVGSDSFDVQVTDAGGQTDTITIEVTVADGLFIDQGDTRTFPVLKNTDGNELALSATGDDPEGLVWSIATPAAAGAAEVSGAGESAQVSYSPDADFVGSDTFEVQVSDAGGRSDTITIEVTVVDVPERHVWVRFRVADFGEFVVELFPEIAPITVANFLQYVNDGFFNGKVWHRVIADFMIQTGRFSEQDGVIVGAEVRDEIPGEADGASSNLRGTASMALRSGEPDSGAEGFFVNLVDNTNLDWDGSFGHTVFGKVVEGMDIVDAIGAVETTSKPAENGQTFDDVPVDAVVIESVEVTSVLNEPVIDQGDTADLDVDEDSGANSLALSATAQNPGSLAWSITSEPDHGTAEMSGTGGAIEVLYTPDRDFFGSDSFAVEVADNQGGTDSITVNVSVKNVPDENPQVRVVVAGFGDIVIELFIDFTPVTVRNFLQYVDDGFYDGHIWHRTIDELLIQAGRFRFENNVVVGDEVQPAIINEAGQAPFANTRGTVSMALENGDPSSGAAGFLINLIENPELDDNKHTVFGRVFEGIETVADEIGRVLTTARVFTIDDKPVEFPDFPVDPVVITEIVIVGAPVIDQGEARTFPVLKNTSGNENEFSLSATGAAPESFVWSIATPAGSGTAEVSGAGGSTQVSYTPNTDFVGTDTFVVEVTDTRGFTDAITVDVTVVDIPDGEVRVRFTIANFGDFVVKLSPATTPTTVANFLQYVDEGFFDGKIWHRVIAGFMIQTGRFSEEGGVIVAADIRDEIPGEADGAPSNARGTISMALRSGEPNSGAEGLFINLVDNTHLDWNGSFGHTVFGEVVEGMGVVDAISVVPTGSKPVEGGGTFDDVPDDPVVITAIVRE